MEERISMKCPDGKKRSFLLQMEGILSRKYVIYEVHFLGNSFVDSVDSRNDVYDAICRHYPKWVEKTVKKARGVSFGFIC